MAQPNVVAIPMKLDAFVFNPSVCNGSETDAKIAPLTQPNFTFLQLKDSLIQSDILDQTDLHNSIPSSSNPRLMDLGQQTIRSNRIGIYLHWILPRFYRGGAAGTSSATDHQSKRQKKGFQTASAKTTDFSNPEFRPLPNRWLVIRKLEKTAPYSTSKGSASIEINAIETWMIESDRMRSIDDSSLDNADLQVDVSPYITSKRDPSTGINIEQQAEIFIGYKQDARSWKEDKTQQRADLTVVSSSNHLFPDYQPHCSNVFSTLDTFACTQDGQPSNLTTATASYYVIGWHDKESNDPFGDLVSTGSISRRDRLDALNMVLNGKAPWPEAITTWLDQKTPVQVLCHGALYNVVWTADKLPQNVPANVCANDLADKMPVAVGTTPIDSLLAYVDTHHDSDIEADLHLIGPLLRTQDEGVDALRTAIDEVQNWNFARTPGGVYWHFQNTPGEPAVNPTKNEKDNLEILNNTQQIHDSTQRFLLQARWEIFSCWWQYACLTAEDRTTAKFPLEDLNNRITALNTIINTQKSVIDKYSTNPEKYRQLPRAGVRQGFQQPRDPTFLIAGVESGWPDDYLDKLTVRFDNQTVLPKDATADASTFCTDKLPTEDLRRAALALAQEFIALDPSQGTVTPSAGSYLPLYHDHGKHGSDKDPLRDQWGDCQAWFPLFIEWEVEYFHIKWSDWDLVGKDTKISHPLWRSGIKDKVNLADEDIQDTRTMSGRVLLLPQPSFSLQTQINSLFNSIDPKIIESYLPEKEQRDEILNNVYKLPILSAPLDGFIDNLITLMHGTHIKPTVRYPARENDLGVQPLPDAEIGPFTNAYIQQIEQQSELTPYGSLVMFETPAQPGTNTEIAPSPKESPKTPPVPFKPVTHGQFRFRKLNIIDKFGQAICGIDPRYEAKDQTAIFPCISDYLTPPSLGDGTPNIVRSPKPDQKGHNEFVQIPPQINQPARMNTTFVKYDERNKRYPADYSYWRPVTELEDPIWGWLILNYVDYGLQIFLPDGTFYREVRIASPTAPKVTSVSAKWLPFPPPESKPNTDQLDQLLGKLTDKDQTYLLAFLAMANKSLEATSSVPSAYATFLNSLVGRPLALVNAGWSLELASDSKKSQSSLDKHETTSMPWGLLEGDGKDVYTFPVKIGDRDRAHDGLVGYFEAFTSPEPGNELDLTNLYTYFAASPATGPMHPIDTTNYPRLPSFWLKPDNYSNIPKPETMASAYARDWNKNLRVFGLIMDPFVPVTTYSSILPINDLQLSSWTWESAMKKMTAFFHMGPMVITNDVQSYWDPKKTLHDGYTLDPPSQDETVPGSAVAIPALQTADWAWIQPFINPDAGNAQEYMALGLGRVDGRPKYEPGPYTAIEGYLQLKAPIIRPEASEKKS